MAHITITDDFANCDKVEIRYTGDSIYIDIPKKRSATMLVKILKIILINLIK